MPRHNDKLEKHKISHVFRIIAAWLVVAIIAVTSVICSSLIASVILGGQFESEDVFLRFVIVIGLAGFQLLFALHFVFWNHKKHVMLKHITLGLQIGMCSYGSLFALGTVGFIVANGSKFDQQSNLGCSTIAEQYYRLTESVVPIATESGTGTGFAVKDGHTILTAYHVIEGAASIKINFVNDERIASIIDTAPNYDLALLRIEKPMVTSMSLTDVYKATDSLYALGFPGNAFDAGQASLSSGVLSRVLANDDLKLNDITIPDGLEMIQTDMALNSGNSGGPIINRCGVVGVVSAKSNSLGLESISSEEGINYGISSKTAAQRFRLPIVRQ